MKIKVQCPCETRFEFEVEPVNGRMPMPISCPACGADATALANDLIKQQIAAAPAIRVTPVAAPSPAARMHVATASAPAPAAPAPPPAAKLSISKSHTAPAAAAQPAPPDSASTDAESEAAPAGQPCPRHKGESSVETCVVCGKPICLKCMEQFGYVCSAYCRQQATLKRIYIPVYAHQKSVVSDKSHALAKRLTFAITVLVVGVLGFWFWYTWFARDPKIVYVVHIPKPDELSHKYVPPDGFYQLIGPGQLAIVKDKKLSVVNLARNKDFWSAPLQSEAEAAAIQAARAKKEEIIKHTAKVRDAHGFDVTDYPGIDPLGESDDYEFANPNIVATTNDIWISFASHLLRFDRQSGSPKPVAIKDKILSVTPGDDAILVVSGAPATGQTLTEITLPDGNLQSEALTVAPPVEVASAAKTADKKAAASKTKPAKPDPSVNKIPVGQIKNLATQQAATPAPADPDAEASFDSFDEPRTPFIAAGPNVVQFTAKLLEQKMVSHVAMKAKGKSVFDSENVTASQGIDAAQEMMNDSRREMTGGMETEDVSRYQVTLHRRFAQGIPDWTGEVTGPPQFFALKTVDVIAAGQSIYVFDKNNKKLWDAKLTFSFANHFDRGSAPCLETKDALYFADLGILTRYDLATGNVRWRYNSVGISKIQADSHGRIVINTTTAGPDSIQYSQQINIRDKIHPVIASINPDTGKVLWVLSSVGENCFISGKFLYSTMVSTTMAALHLEDGPDTHYYLNLLDPANGHEIWGFHRGNQHIIKTEVQKLDSPPLLGRNPGDEILFPLATGRGYFAGGFLSLRR